MVEEKGTFVARITSIEASFSPTIVPRLGRSMSARLSRQSRRVWAVPAPSTSTVTLLETVKVSLDLLCESSTLGLRR